MEIIMNQSDMNKEKHEQQNQKKNNEKFNSITQKAKPENQNQHHNVKKEAVNVDRRQM